MDDISLAAGAATHAELDDGRTVTPRSDIQEALVEAIRDAIIPLTDQLQRAEQRIVDERARADRILAEKDAAIAGLEAEKQGLQRQVDDALAAELAAHGEAAVARARLVAVIVSAFVVAAAARRGVHVPRALELMTFTAHARHGLRTRGSGHPCGTASEPR